MLGWRGLRKGRPAELLPAMSLNLFLTHHSPSKINNIGTMMVEKSQREFEAEVRSWGFPHVFTWTDGP
jgi:hypothetical protein